jgi:hypothetical protein
MWKKRTDTSASQVCVMLFRLPNLAELWNRNMRIIRWWRVLDGHDDANRAHLEKPMMRGLLDARSRPSAGRIFTLHNESVNDPGLRSLLVASYFIHSFIIARLVT